MGQDPHPELAPATGVIIPDERDRFGRVARLLGRAVSSEPELLTLRELLAENARLHALVQELLTLVAELRNTIEKQQDHIVLLGFGGVLALVERAPKVRGFKQFFQYANSLLADRPKGGRSHAESDDA